MTTTTIQQKNLKAVSHAMAIGDRRYWLNGVLIEFNGAENRLVATDGHRLHMVIEDLTGLVTEPVGFIMPADMVKTCIKAKGHSGEINLTYDAGKIEARLPDGSSIISMAIDGKFPDYARVIPAESTLNPEPAVFQPSYLVDADKGLRDFLELKKSQTPSVGITPRGNSTAVLSVTGFTAIVMPIRAELTTCADLRMTQPIAKPE